MKLSEINVRVDELRAKRAGLHEELHALLADDDIKAGDLRKREAALRAQIREINVECFPMEVVRGKTTRLLKGGLKPEEQGLYDQCVEQIGGVEVG